MTRDTPCPDGCESLVYLSFRPRRYGSLGSFAHTECRQHYILDWLIHKISYSGVVIYIYLRARSRTNTHTYAYRSTRTYIHTFTYAHLYKSNTYMHTFSHTRARVRLFCIEDWRNEKRHKPLSGVLHIIRIKKHWSSYYSRNSIQNTLLRLNLTN